MWFFKSSCVLDTLKWFSRGTFQDAPLKHILFRLNGLKETCYFSHFRFGPPFLLRKSQQRKTELRYNAVDCTWTITRPISPHYLETLQVTFKRMSHVPHKTKSKIVNFHHNKSFLFPLLWLNPCLWDFFLKQMKMAKLYNSATKFIWRFRVWLQFWMVVWCCRCSLNPFRMQIFLFSLFCGFQA